MKLGQKVYIPMYETTGTITEIEGGRIKYVKIGDKIVNVFYIVVKNWDTITKIVLFLGKLLKI
jgi:hypothetical protein